MKKKGKVIEKPTSQDGGGGADRERSAAADPAVGQRHRAGRQEDAQDEGEKLHHYESTMCNIGTVNLR